MYGAVLTGDSLDKTYRFEADFDSSYTLLALALGTKMNSLVDRYLNFGVEAQLAKHFGGQKHLEINGLLVFRWIRFPWNAALDTTFATGTGVSIATEVPEIEKLYHDKQSQVLGYLLLEFTFTLPQYPKWSLSTRIHHRSGADQFFSSVRGGSNALGLGIAYSF
jgi:hypothetical protein